MSFSHEINMVLSAGEFKVYCQSLTHADNQQCIGVELLLRWHNRRHGVISPDVFILLAKQQNLTSALTCFVIREVVKSLEQFPKMYEFHISLNVAVSHFKDSVIIEYLYRYWFPFHPEQQLILELTEGDALPEVGQSVVHDLHHLEIKLTIDDFGSG